MKTRHGRVLYVGPDIKGTGGISVVLQRYRRFVPGFTFLPTNSRRGFLPGLMALSAVMALLPFYRLAGYKVLHAQGASGKSFRRKKLVLLWGRLLGFRTIFHCHGGGFKDFAESYGTESVSAFLRSCSAVGVLTESWKKYFTEALRCPHVHVLHNVADAPGAPVERTPLPAGEPVRFLFVGKICREKGVFDLMEAAAVLKEAGAFEIHIAGSGDDAALAGKIEHLGIADTVKIHGLVHGEPKDALLRHCHVMVLPSYVEGLPLVLLEAAAYSMPMIATPVGGIPELVEEGVNGCLVPPGDVKALAEAMCRYISRHELIYRQGARAALSVEPYSPEAVRRELDLLYESL